MKWRERLGALPPLTHAPKHIRHALGFPLASGSAGTIGSTSKIRKSRTLTRPSTLIEPAPRTHDGVLPRERDRLASRGLSVACQM
jgi:hypothetical protein